MFKTIFTKVVFIPLGFLLLISVSLAPRAESSSFLLSACELPHNEPQPEVIVEKPFNYWRTPVLGKGYIGFREALAFKESRGDYSCVNKYGYLGKYQFSPNTLKLIGIQTPYSFLSQPILQEKAFLANAIRNKWVLRRYIKRYAGTYVNGVYITESGMIAAAHLAGPANVKRFFNSTGQTDFKDAFGTKLSHYLKRFSDYDTSELPAIQKPKANQL